MSEPDGAEIGRRIGDHSADIIADDAVACCAAADTARPPDFAQHQGEIGHRGRQIQLEFRLDRDYRSRASGPGGCPAGPAGPICAPLPPVALDTRRSRRFAARPGPVATCLPGDGSAPVDPSCLGPRCTGSAADIPDIPPRRTGKPAIGRHDRRHPSAFPPARWCG